jgi:hypothetical protein
MGGNALRHLGVTRRQLPEYTSIKTRVLDILRDYYELVETPREPPGKTSFGDLDVLVASPIPGKTHVHTDPRFHSRGFVKNGHIISFEYDNFQIDRIRVSAASFKLSLAFFHGNFGMILGKLLRKYRLSFGHESFGIKYECKQGLVYFELSTDLDAILESLKLPPFPEHSLHDADIVEYLSQGLLDLRVLKGHVDKNPRCVDVLFIINALEGNAVNNDNIVQHVLDSFGKTREFQEFTDAILQKEQLHTVFNGGIVRELTGLQDRELGEFMRQFKTRYSTKDILDVVECGLLESTVREFKKLQRDLK